MARLKDYYVDAVAPALMKKFNYKSVMEIPKLDKVIVNVGAGEAISNSKVIDAIVNDITQITGQKPVICRAKKSVANFKLREGMPIGVKVTLRRENMYEFVDKLFNVAFPRVRDFRGIILILLTAEEITQQVSRNSLFSLRSSMIRLTKSEVWI